MNIEQQVKEAIEEFGEFAHERFVLIANGFGEQNKNNDTLLHILEYDKYLQNHEIKLKPLPELLAYDMKVYGDDAYLMWEYEAKYLMDDVIDCNHAVITAWQENYEIVRKNSAALQFCLERAKAGDAVEVMINSPKKDGFEWVDFNSGGCKVNWDYPDVDYSDYRHKYPRPLK